MHHGSHRLGWIDKRYSYIQNLHKKTRLVVEPFIRAYFVVFTPQHQLRGTRTRTPRRTHGPQHACLAVSALGLTCVSLRENVWIFFSLRSTRKNVSLEK